MLQETKRLLLLSRPRFWLYVFGPYLLGVTAGGFGSVSWPLVILAGLYFTFPANLLIYGVNDLFDYETDKHNPKKSGYELRVTPESRERIKNAILFINIPFLILLSLFGASNDMAFNALLLFLFFGVMYSAPPIRAKTKPFLDSFFNILYIFPGVFGFALITNQWPSLAVILAGTFWVMAMHAYSAVPDIASDKKANIRTIATVLKARGTLLFCALCYLLAGILSYQVLGQLAVWLSLLYVGLMVMSMYLLNSKGVFALYTRFPFINMLVGFILFLAIIY